MKAVLLRVLLCGCFLPCTVFAADGVTGTVKVTQYFEPSNLKTALVATSSTETKKFKITIACYDVLSGKLSNCDYTYVLLGLVKDSNQLVEVNGGHTHNYSSHPVGKASAPGFADQQLIESSTKSQAVTIIHEIPEVSGKVEAQLDVKIPVSQPNTFCAYNCFDNTYKGWRTLYTMDIRVIRMLTSLPDDPAYVKHRNPDISHTDDNAYYSTPSTQLYLKAVAMEYKKTSGRILSVNDMSLPKGGLFDTNDDWKSPHALHRTGTSADINWKVSGLNCTEDLKLKDAANLKIPPLTDAQWGDVSKDKAVRSGPYLCEIGNKNNIHLDFDSHTIDVSK